MSSLDWPRLGYGVGLRAEHYDHVLTERPPVDWFEALTENYLDTGGRPLHVLEAVRRDYPVALHGVALSLGGSDPLDRAYLRRLRGLVDRIAPAVVSDHLCWTGVDGRPLHDLLPLPYTEEVLHHVAARVGRVQEALGRRIALENPSTYLGFRHSTMPEWEFLAALAAEADCGILLDVNNVHVSARNLGFDASAYVAAIPAARVAYVHLAGFSHRGRFLFDTHDAPVHEDVWALYRFACDRLGAPATLIEWDANLPPFARLHAEAERARRETPHEPARHPSPRPLAA